MQSLRSGWRQHPPLTRTQVQEKGLRPIVDAGDMLRDEIARHVVDLRCEDKFLIGQLREEQAHVPLDHRVSRGDVGDELAQ